MRPLHRIFAAVAALGLAGAALAADVVGTVPRISRPRWRTGSAVGSAERRAVFARSRGAWCGAA